MAYLDQSRRASPGSMVAVIGVHAAMAGVLVIGLNVSGIVQLKDGPLVSILPKTPPPKPDETVEPKEPTSSEIYTPLPPLPMPPRDNRVDTTDIPLPPMPPIPQPGPRPLPDPGPTVTPSLGFTPVAAKPRNDPGRWLSDSDYRSSWVRKEMVGTARFRLEITATGKVAGCTITGSTGHSELDAATCALVSKRARFEPARGSEGEPVAGSYSSSVRWVLPE